MNELRKQVGRRLKELRLARGLTQEQLGERADLSYKFIGEVERGVGNPTLDTLASLADALDVLVADLVAEPRSAAMYGQLSERDYVVVRDARDSLESMLSRLGGGRTRKRRR